MSSKASKPKRAAAYARRSSKHPQISIARQMAVIRKYRAPTSNRQYWTKKQSRNSQRDKIVGRQLKQSGWNVIRIWEHELRNSTRVLVRIERARQAK